MVLLYPTKPPRRKKWCYCTLQNRRGGKNSVTVPYKTIIRGKKDVTVPYKTTIRGKKDVTVPYKTIAEAKRMLLYPTKPRFEAKENGAVRELERLRCMCVRLTS